MKLTLVFFCVHFLSDFQKVGTLVGMSIIHGGSRYPFFAPSMYQYICGKGIGLE